MRTIRCPHSCDIKNIRMRCRAETCAVSNKTKGEKMKETKVLKEIGSKRTGDTREYLMSDGSRRVIMRLATDKRAATVRDGVEIENYQIDNYIDKLNAYPDPLSEYNIVYY